MKVLIVGNVYHQFNIYFANALRNEFNGIQIDSLNTFPQKRKDKDGYDNFINLWNYRMPYSNTNWFIKIISPLLGTKVVEKLDGDYDAIIIHSANFRLINFTRFLKSKSKKLLVTIWGSDFYRVSNVVRDKLKTLFDAVDWIIPGTPSLEKNFLSYYPEYKIKTSYNFAGIEPLENLNDLLDNICKTDILSEFGIEREKTIITVGHSGAPANNHLEIINTIKLSKEIEFLQNDVFFIFPMTYGNSKRYISSVKNYLKNFPYDFLVLEDFLNNEQVAKLRMISDIYLNLQTTDSLSGTMLEVLYAGNILITGAWLPYEILNEWNIHFHQINDFNELPAKLIKIVTKIKEEKKICENRNNRDIIYHNFSWKNTIKTWHKFFNQKVYNAEN